MADQGGDPTASPPSTASVAPGWYVRDDPATEWWWDGAAWTEHQRPASAGLPPPPAPAFRCMCCGWTELRVAQFMLNTQGLTLLGWDGFNKTAVCQICNRCGFIHWFAPPTAAR